MKRAAIVIAMLGISAWGIAQSNDKPGAQSPPTGQSTGQAAVPAGQREPMAKTQPEYDAWKAPAALTNPAAQEDATNDLAAKYPHSEVRPILYSEAIHCYNQANS